MKPKTTTLSPDELELLLAQQSLDFALDILGVDGCLERVVHRIKSRPVLPLTTSPSQ